MPSRFDEWKKEAELIERKMSRLGSHVRRVEFKMDDFLAWAKLHGRDIDSASRLDYVEFIATKVKPD